MNAPMNIERMNHPFRYMARLCKRTVSYVLSSSVSGKKVTKGDSQDEEVPSNDPLQEDDRPNELLLERSPARHVHTDQSSIMRLAEVAEVLMHNCKQHDEDAHPRECRCRPNAPAPRDEADIPHSPVPKH